MYYLLHCGLDTKLAPQHFCVEALCLFAVCFFVDWIFALADYSKYLDRQFVANLNSIDTRGTLAAVCVHFSSRCL